MLFFWPMYEHRKQPLATNRVFMRRLGRSGVASLILVLTSLMLGMLGYHYLEGLSWIESYEEASMILSGMGPTAPMQSTLGKFFSGTYALYSGLMLILTMGVVIAPIAHRFFHKFHMDISDD